MTDKEDGPAIDQKVMRDKIKKAFTLGFMSSREGFNGEAIFDDCAPTSIIETNDDEEFESFSRRLHELDEFKSLFSEAIRLTGY